jgi:hypothetical protein
LQTQILHIFGHVLTGIHRENFLNLNLTGGVRKIFLTPPACQHFWEKYGIVVIFDPM